MKERGNLRDLGVDGKITLKYIFDKRVVWFMGRINLVQMWWGSVVNAVKITEFYKKGCEFLDQLRYCQLPKDSALWS
jgi:hypothetical protein